MSGNYKSIKNTILRDKMDKVHTNNIGVRNLQRLDAKSTYVKPRIGQKPMLKSVVKTISTFVDPNKIKKGFTHFRKHQNN